MNSAEVHAEGPRFRLQVAYKADLRVSLPWFNSFRCNKAAGSWRSVNVVLELGE